MKSFKLKKWYPSLPKEWKDKEVIVDRICNNYQERTDKSTAHHLSVEEVLNNEFWEEMEEKSYQITKIQLKSVNPELSLLERKSNGRFVQENFEVGRYEAEHLLSNNLSLLEEIYPGEGFDQLEELNYEIYEVEDLENNNTFKIGDIVEHYTSPNDRGVIESFTLFSWGISAGFKGISKKYYNKSLSNNINVLRHSKVLFTTEDKVDFYNGDEVWYVNPDNDLHYINSRKKSITLETYEIASKAGGKYFSSQKEAEKWVENKKAVKLLQEAKEKYTIGKVINSCKGYTNFLLNSTDLEKYPFKYKEGNIFGYGVTLYLDGKWAEIVDNKSLKYYESLLLKMRGSKMIDGTFIYNGDFYKRFKETEPKLYWTKILQLIADDLNEGWKPDWTDNTVEKWFIKKCTNRAITIDFFITSNPSIIAFKSDKKAKMAIKIMDDKLNLIFEE